MLKLVKLKPATLFVNYSAKQFKKATVLLDTLVHTSCVRSGQIRFVMVQCTWQDTCCDTLGCSDIQSELQLVVTETSNSASSYMACNSC